VVNSTTHCQTLAMKLHYRPVLVCVTGVYCDKWILPEAMFHQLESSCKALTFQTLVANLQYSLHLLRDRQGQNLDTPKTLLVVHVCNKKRHSYDIRRQNCYGGITVCIII
jgi:hypothetical protein